MLCRPQSEWHSPGLENRFFSLEASGAGNKIFPPVRKQIHLPIILLLRL